MGLFIGQIYIILLDKGNFFRDSLLASLIDGVRASGNLDVHVRMTSTPRGCRWGPLECPVEEEVVLSHLKFFQQLPIKLTFENVIERFNANVSYSGFEVRLLFIFCLGLIVEVLVGDFCPIFIL